MRVRSGHSCYNFAWHGGGVGVLSTAINNEYCSTLRASLEAQEMLLTGCLTTDDVISTAIMSLRALFTYVMRFLASDWLKDLSSQSYFLTPFLKPLKRPFRK